MSLFEGIRDVADILQKAKNYDLYKRLLDLSEQASEMQEEISRLKEENKKLIKKQDMSNRIVRHTESYITLKEENQNLYYCSNCWDVEQLLVQLTCNDNNGTFNCPHCHMEGIYDKEKANSVSTEWIDLM